MEEQKEKMKVVFSDQKDIDQKENKGTGIYGLISALIGLAAFSYGVYVLLTL